MRRGHFESLQPVCPVCQQSDPDSLSPLQLATVAFEQDDHVIEGALRCSRPDCQHEYPIIDGVPLIVPTLRSFVGEHAFALCRRLDLGEVASSLIGDCCGPGSPFDALRQQLSCYVWDHYGEHDPMETPGPCKPGGLLRLLQQGLDARGQGGASPVSGPVLDVGCSVGGGSFALAERSDLVLGVDMNVAMLRVAAETLRTGRVSYDRRRVGIVYDRRDFAVEVRDASKVDFWCCDATCLPFSDESFSFSTALNVLDSISAPQRLLAEMTRTLTPGGQFLMACPYDWSSAATPIENWLGGHSQRAAEAGSSDQWLRHALSQLAEEIAVVHEEESVPWDVRLHDRSSVNYVCHLLLCQRAGAAPS